MQKFYLGLPLEPYKNDEKRFRGLTRELRSNGFTVLDAFETEITSTKTGEKMYDTLLLFLMGTRENMFKLKAALNKKSGIDFMSEYEGYPLLM